MRIRKIILLFLFLHTVFLGQNIEKGSHALFFMPTAYTIESGTAYFTLYELIYMNLVYAPTGRTHVGLFMVVPFPLTNTYSNTFTMGIKQNWLRTSYFEGALFATYTFENAQTFISNVFSFGNQRINFHGSYGFVSRFDVDKSWESIYMVGAKLKILDKFFF